MEGRVHNEFDAIETPIGFIPQYSYLRNLFRQIFSRDYTKEEYEKQFSIRIKKHLEKLDRIEPIFRAEEGVPEVFYTHLSQQRERLKKCI